MVRRRLLLAALFLVLALPFRGEFFSKKYDFAQERWIRLNEKVGEVEVQDIIFQFPAYLGPRKFNVEGRNRALVNVKNYGTTKTRVYVAVALFDGSGHLVGCGTNGNKLWYARPGKTESFSVPFSYVKSQLATAQTFYLAVETEPAL